ncbi:MAG: hypothetical protein IV100_14840 [Myxococcales bacterium]|nr:hypothetical protein [Myxococcales bacterium]
MMNVDQSAHEPTLSTPEILRAAYERGRRRLALVRSVWAVPFGVFALLVLGAPTGLTALITLALAAVFAFTQNAGRSVGRGGRVGLLFGLVPLISPWFVQSTHLCCVGGACSTNCMQMCALGGLLAGVGLALLARRDPSPPRYAAGGGLVMLAASGLGCAALEWGGLLGVGAGLVATLPVLVTTPARA